MTAHLRRQEEELRAAKDGGGARQRGQEPVPGDDEPRDPHPHERRDRHDEPSVRNAAHRRAAGVCGHDPGVRRDAARAHRRHPRLFQDGDRAAEARVGGIQPARMRRGRGGRRWRRAARRRGRIALRERRGRAGLGPGRRQAAAPGAGQPARQRRQVHGARRGVGERGRRPAPGAAGAPLRRPRHGHRHPAPGDGQALPCVFPGRRLDHPPIRGHGPRAGHLPAAGRDDGRHGSGSRASPARARPFTSRSRSGSRGAGAP